LASKIDAIASNSEVWAKTAFILNYDENDGLFDHGCPARAATRHTRRNLSKDCRLGLGSACRASLFHPWTGRGLGMQSTV